MIENKVFTAKEQKELIANMVILIDSREKEINHIKEFFAKKCIKHEIVTLRYGDYSFYTSIHSSTYDFRRRQVIERKNSLDEIITNFTAERGRFENEFLKMSRGCRCLLLIENNCIDDIVEGNYRSQAKQQSIIASFLTFKHRYNLDSLFCKSENTGLMIYKYFYYLLHTLVN
jgi:ERCC4-type nuclease